MSMLSNPQLASCLHGLCFKCITDKKSYCWECQQPVSVIGANLALVTAMKKKSGEDVDMEPEESMDDYARKQFAELAIKVDSAVDELEEKLKQLEELKTKLKMRAVIEPLRAHDSMKKQINESRVRTIHDIKSEAKRHLEKWDTYIEANKKEHKRLGKEVVIAERFANDGALALKHPGIIHPIKKSMMTLQSPTPSMLKLNFGSKMDLRFGMLMSLSFMDAYKILAQVIPEDVLQKCYCQRLRIGVGSFTPFINHLKTVEKHVYPPPFKIKEKVFAFSDFSDDECVGMITTLMALKEKVRSSESENATHIIVRSPVASLEIFKVIFSGGWMLKSTFVSNAKILNVLPHEIDHEWTTLKLGESTFNPRICRQAIHRRGKPFSKLFMVVCTSNTQDSELLRAGGAEGTVDVSQHPHSVQNAVEVLIRSGKNKNQIIVVCNQSDEVILRKVSKMVKVPIHTLDKIIDLIMRGWFDRFNPMFSVRHHFNPGRPVK